MEERTKTIWKKIKKQNKFLVKDKGQKKYLRLYYFIHQNSSNKR